MKFLGSPLSDWCGLGLRTLSSLLRWIVPLCGGGGGGAQRKGASILPGDPSTEAPRREVVVQVYILLGQSNMLGMGRIPGPDQDGTLEHAVLAKGLYPYLLDGKEWRTSPSVRNVRVMDAKRGGMQVFHNEFLTVCGDTLGPEFGIGHLLEASANEPILLLKSCIGNRSLGWDLLPPGSQRYEYGGRIYAGYGEAPAFWDPGTTPPPPQPGDWYAGRQYDSDVAHAHTVLDQLGTFYPGATDYQVQGFFWWQGDKDRYQEAYCQMYEANLCRLIGRLRADFGAPNAKFVLATLGQTTLEDPPGNDQRLLEAMLAVDGSSGHHPEFQGNVSCVYAHPLSKGGSSNGHYNGNAETYMNIGEAMGTAMVELVSTSTTTLPPTSHTTHENETV